MKISMLHKILMIIKKPIIRAFFTCVSNMET